MLPRSAKTPVPATDISPLAQELLRYTPSLLPLAEHLEIAAQHDVTVLLMGETGTGKTHLAQLIHAHSPRRQHRLLIVPCGALSAGLIESELFGHVRGAFSGADRTKVGKFEAAGEGTLLLDEVDVLGLNQQAKLLRVLETGAYEPVGSNETRACQARIIAASNWDLNAAVDKGRFRADLYYRLNVLSFHLPPLRERREDIGPLAQGMVERFSEKFHKGVVVIAPEALAALKTFPWPGNLRQLQNVLQQAVLRSSGPELLRQHLPPDVADFAPSASFGSLAAEWDQQERRTIEQALQDANQSRSRAARALGISRVTLHKKLNKHGLSKRWRSDLDQESPHRFAR
jgi:transcriptional regulator with PAS, ATPase and Fis domain